MTGDIGSGSGKSDSGSGSDHSQSLDGGGDSQNASFDPVDSTQEDDHGQTTQKKVHTAVAAHTDPGLTLERAQTLVDASAAEIRGHLALLEEAGRVVTTDVGGATLYRAVDQMTDAPTTEQSEAAEAGAPGREINISTPQEQHPLTINIDLSEFDQDATARSRSHHTARTRPEVSKRSTDDSTDVQRSEQTNPPDGGESSSTNIDGDSPSTDSTPATVQLTDKQPTETQQSADTDTKSHGGDSNHSQHAGDTSSSATQSGEQRRGRERVSFFPARREIVVNNPSERLRQRLSKVAHLVEAAGEGYMYKVSSSDVWNVPFDTFLELVEHLQAIVGEENWSPSFEERLQSDWKASNAFELVTDDSKGYTKLVATNIDLRDAARQKLKSRVHYTKLLDDENALRIAAGATSDVKQLLYEEGYPVTDNRDVEEGDSLPIELDGIELRDYQQEWVDRFMERKSGTFVGPFGSGKTVAAIGVMATIEQETLILVPGRDLAEQWQAELVEKTTLTSDDIAQYHGGKRKKVVGSVTIATYQTIARTEHRKLMDKREWGLVIADEAHYTPAETWKRFHQIQSRARLGLTGSPVREDGNSQEIYTLIGPPVGTDWAALFEQGHVENPTVEIIRVPWATPTERKKYQRLDGHEQRIHAAMNGQKVDVVEQLLQRHRDQQVVLFVEWIDQGTALADALDIPFLHGETSHDRRQEVLDAFREGEQQALILSRIGDEGIDLPNAEACIICSTKGGSRSQTAQRIGRVMRPSGAARGYLLLTKGTKESDFGRQSTQYLAEQGIQVQMSEVNNN